MNQTLALAPMPRYSAWAASVLAHGLAVWAAVTLLGDLTLAPQPEPFHWEVAMVDPPPAPPEAQPAPSPPVQSEPQQPVEPGRSKPQPVEPERVEPVQPVQELQPVERTPESQPAREPEPQVQTPPVQETVAATEPVQEVAPVQDVPAAEAPPPPVVPPPAPTVATAPPTSPPAADPVPSAEEAAPVSKPVVVVASAPPNAASETVVTRQTKRDFGWLRDELFRRVNLLKRYPAEARLNRMEGRVVLRAVIQENGHLRTVEVAESSGHSVLDEHAMDVIRLACPLKLKQELGLPEVVVKIPINYKLE